MNTEFDIKKLWHQQDVEAIEPNVLIEKANLLKRRGLYRMITINLLFGITIIYLIVLFCTYKPEFLTTKIGILCLVIAMALYVFQYNKLKPLLSKHIGLNNTEYLDELLKLKEKQRFLQTTMMNVYFILLTTGICLAIFEYLSRMSDLMVIIVYFSVFLWICFNWFYLRPRTIKKDQSKIDGLIEKFKILNAQFELTETS